MTVRTFNHVQSAHGAAATDLVVKQPPELYRYIQIYTDIYNIIYIYMYIYIDISRIIMPGDSLETKVVKTKSS